MTLTPIINGQPVSELQNTLWELNLNATIISKIDQLIDRDVTRSNDKVSPFVEAFNVLEKTNGRNSSVILDESNGYNYTENDGVPKTLTTFVKCTHYVSDESSGDTTHNPDSFGNVDNAFDEDLTSYAEKIVAATGAELGKTFSSKIVDSVFVKASARLGSSTRQVSIILQSYDGSTWSNVETLLDSSDKVEGNFETFTVQKLVNLGYSVQGLRVAFTGTDISSMKVYSLAYGDPAPGRVVLAIPSGTFIDTPSSGVMAVKIVDWEDGASLQWKATNATEDTGWLDFNIVGDMAYCKISSFTAFTNEATKGILKLIPKSTSPTAGVPSVAGMGVILL